MVEKKKSKILTFLARKSYRIIYGLFIVYLIISFLIKDFKIGEQYYSIMEYGFVFLTGMLLGGSIIYHSVKYLNEQIQ